MCGLLVLGYVNGRKLSDKVEKYAIMSYFRGLPYDEETFIVETKVLDDIVTDTCPPAYSAKKKI